MKDYILDESGLSQLALFFSQQLSAGDVLCLKGDLGAGKTRFSCFLAEHLGFEFGKSPTFTLINRYPTRVPMLHLDLYRVASELELQHLDLDLFFESKSHLMVIEWFERLGAYLPETYLLIELDLVSDTHRHVSISGVGSFSGGVLEALPDRF